MKAACREGRMLPMIFLTSLSRDRDMLGAKMMV